MGSPPHTWRILSSIGSAIMTARITSTYVENTVRHNDRLDALRDHLHIRGEYKKIMVQVRLIVGSPPHTWRIRNAFKI